MALFKCKMCGGSLEVAAGTTVIECEYCGTQQTLPKLDDDKRANMYDRANHFRRNNEFDKAMGIYEQILNEDSTDAEAYWSLVLCRYGIEYVEDPSTKRRIPTVNRAQYTSILADEDYKSALANADTYQKSIYELEAKAIDEIQKGILAISQKEEPFDVFICYKETDASGKRTQDSVLAQDLYFGLKNEGFKVFFARITLEDKLGSAYEPYIFAALNSAKVMVVLGTKPEFFSAVWVKNEWSRYLALIKQGQKKMLIPAYKDMDPYDLPEDFSHLQAQDMSKLGFMQDLIRGIKKIVKADEPKQTVVKETVVKETVATTGVSNVAPLLKRAFLFLEDGDFDSADEYAEKVLDINPECSDAYIVKLLVDLRLCSIAQITSAPSPIDKNPNYIKALRFAKGDARNTIEGYNQAIVERIELDNKKKQYENACYFMSAHKYDEAIAAFSKISDFKDSADKIEACKRNKEINRKEAIYANALRDVASTSADDKTIKKSIAALETIKGFKDADAQIEKLQARLEKWYEDKKIADEKARIKAEQDKLEAARLAELRKIKAEQNKKKAKRIAKVAIPSLIALILVIVLTLTLFIPLLRFNKADKLFQERKYNEANQIYADLNGFGKSEQRSDIVQAINHMQSNNFALGIRTLLLAGVPVELTYNPEGGSLTDTQTLMHGNTLSLNDSIVTLSTADTAAATSSDNTVFSFNNNSDFDKLITPSRNGYRFVEWVLDAYSYDVDSKDAKFYLAIKAVWSEKDYTISYDLAEGVVDGTNKVEYDPEDEAFTLINPTRTGYTFMGWTGTGLSEPTMEVTIAKGSYGDRTYTATWEANAYTITYDTAGGALETTSQIIHYDENLELPTPTRDGYTFLGWYVGKDKYKNQPWKETVDATLTAKWSLSTYSVSYNLNGGTNASGNPKTYTMTSNVVLENPTRAGYTFKGWTYSGQNTPAKSPSLKGMYGNKTFNAHWTPNSYTITLDPNGGTCSTKTLPVTYDSSFSLPTPTWEGHTFSGWYNGGTKVNNGTCKFTSDTKLIARWDAITYTITYTMNGGTNPSSNPNYYTYNDKIILAEPTRTGYTFLGWTYSGQTTPTKNVTISIGSIGHKTYTANWKATGYTVTFDANNGNVSTSTLGVTYDASATLPTPTRTGYTFNGWYNGSTKYTSGTWKTASNITLTAKWTARTDVTYVVNHYQQNANDDGYTKESTLNLTGTADATITPTVKSFTHFVSPKTQTVTIAPDGSLVVNYYYDRVTYDLTYVTNGGATIEEQTFKYGQTLVLATPTRTGYTFGGWFTDKTLGTAYSATATLNEDTTIYAYWSEENKPTDFTYSGTYTITVSAYTGTSTTMWIPTYIGGAPVTTISASAFKNHAEIVEAVIPDTVTSIGSYAFSNCIMLEKVQISNRITTINPYTFSGCALLSKVNSDAGNTLNLPEKLKTIDNYAFENLELITKVVVPDTVTSIGLGAFKGCNAIEDITLPFVGASESAEHHNAVFGYIFGYTELVSPTSGEGSMGSIGYSEEFTDAQYSSVDGAVWQYSCKTGNRNMSWVSVRSYFYYIPTTIKSVTITKQTTIPIVAFHNCDFIEEVNLYGCIEIKSRAFNKCKGLIEINLGTALTTIGRDVFVGCIRLEKVTIPNTVTSIGEYAFQGCVSLKRMNSTTDGVIMLPTRLAVISNFAFHNCTAITKVVIGDTTEISHYAFSDCKNISQINSDTEGELIIPNGVTKIGEHAFANLPSITKIIVPDTVIEIDEGAFSGCEALEDITLPFIGLAAALNETSKPTGGYSKAVFGIIFGIKYKHPESVVQNNLYPGYYSIPKTIKTVTITVDTTIPYCAFQNCDFIETITIPATVTSIGDYAFQNCSATVKQTYIPSLSYWNETDISTSFLGSGTESDPYQINSAADLAYLASSVNAGTSYEGKHFVLNINIDLVNQSWTPIGTKTNPFAGMFDGNGKKIHNLSVTMDVAHAGLFGYVSGTIKNLGIASGTIAPTSTAANTYVGPLVGYLTGTVENCYSNIPVSVSTSNTIYAGGLIGHIDTAATVKNSYASGNVTVTTSGFAYAGGFVGMNKGTIEGSLAFGNVTAEGQNDSYSRNGGFAANNNGTLTECYRSESQILIKYITTGSAYCDDGTVDSYSNMIAYAQTNWDSSIWEYELKYPNHK